MKNFKPTVEVSVGNPANEGETYLIFYETGNKIAYRVRVKEAYLGFDNKNNFVITGNGTFLNLEDFKLKSTNISQESENSTEVTKTKSISTESIDIDVLNDFKIKAKTFSLDCEDILLQGKVNMGDVTTVEGEEGEDKTENVYSYDSVMTVNKFINFYNKKFIPFFNWVIDAFNEYNKHTHGVAPTEKPVVGSPTGSGKVKSSELKDLQTSQNVKAL